VWSSVGVVVAGRYPTISSPRFPDCISKLDVLRAPSAHGIKL
jgi:hypothetical protein